ncbi:Hsp20/alpha crystallin family protein [Runella sp. MFBS21]|uniref:Hsp20/alpha crystallin family protein n=1 Tax=Runella sp. MFBS21 TaxID=3034018 RepID=UPI0023F93931|nr:Hsp20/alpha crystallin family protein [Runella sp. MFBS21]MDF7822107.1 Hsp20/alpha crystallin family protein [Runella sp. MFBS21]
MKTKIEIPQDILTAIDFANTTNGGMSEPQVVVAQQEEGYDVKIKAAGLEADSFQVDVLNNRLWVYHLLPLFAERPDGMDNLQTVRTLANVFLPNDVDSERITARYDFKSQQLHIHLPHKYTTRNFRRHIDIEY